MKGKFLSLILIGNVVGTSIAGTTDKILTQQEPESSPIDQMIEQYKPIELSADELQKLELSQKKAIESGKEQAFNTLNDYERIINVLKKNGVNISNLPDIWGNFAYRINTTKETADKLKKENIDKNMVKDEDAILMEIQHDIDDCYQNLIKERLSSAFTELLQMTATEFDENVRNNILPEFLKDTVLSRVLKGSIEKCIMLIDDPTNEKYSKLAKTLRLSVPIMKYPGGANLLLEMYMSALLARFSKSEFTIASSLEKFWGLVDESRIYLEASKISEPFEKMSDKQKLIHISALLKPHLQKLDKIVWLPPSPDLRRFQEVKMSLENIKDILLLDPKFASTATLIENAFSKADEISLPVTTFRTANLVLKTFHPLGLF